MININQRIISTTKQLITWLVNKDYKTLENFSNGIRLTADQLQEAVAEYGHTLIMPPDEKFTAFIDLIGRLSRLFRLCLNESFVA